ncbi:hypothetical protein CLAFUW4_00900 [Fulvia fulva]|uniref:A-kinase anchor protein 7-like phosphoesterase domain-containing protein n=1 Tax=Passalora fulva TaxID=5499 RepID=A0A9Q8P4J8_PASFU|nr:uncharacterized protein CLAFUR5_00903 [Fulvia fulva]KAK4634727.1 hypothetical protein CLAFUR4_00901 [Fulvia fulva]KAK4637481.1 hypothetical protein CLAFUR0_00901 [Fulvia fulva]UJO12812.1 hypothetical protein CLAFUR5_00903 [Fulvia fulva]WPV09765.1 hypothetical protein CLAFUW4_00900 [Fulvia fulva]WPV24584.1 hypothetical protein CLAFUW7_00916 [Fulvia fulva]
MEKTRGSKGAPAKKPALTHFLCLPLVTKTSRPQLEHSLKLFKTAVRPMRQDDAIEAQSDDDDTDKATSAPDIHHKAIRPVDTLHCTLGVMSLKPEQLVAAITCLETLDVIACLQGQGQAIPETDELPNTGHPSLDRPPTTAPIQALKVNLKGLESMHAPEKTSILYSAPKDDSDRLYPFCLAVQKLFKDKGFLVDDDRKLKLHATIVNTIYAKGRQRRRPKRDAMPQASSGSGNTEQGHGAKANALLKIDARPVIEQYKDFVWAEDVVLDRMAICEMGAKKSLDAAGNVIDERYTEVASIALPL